MNIRGFPCALAALFLLTVWAHHALGRLSAPSPAPETPRRIVSLAPSITETLYALGLGPQVAGVTQFCLYPPEAARVPRVAGFSDVRFEALVRTRPDLVLLPRDKADNRRRLERLGLSTLSLETLSLDGFMNSVTLLGKAAGREDEAASLRRALQESLDAARERARGHPRPLVLFSVMRSSGDVERFGEITAAGRDGFYNELIAAAGGRNVYQGGLAFPRLSREALLFLNPDVIIDVIPPHDDPESARRHWRTLASVSAVRNGRVFVLNDAVHTVPGPRFPQTLAVLSRAFHPDTPEKNP